MYNPPVPRMYFLFLLNFNSHVPKKEMNVNIKASKHLILVCFIFFLKKIKKYTKTIHKKNTFSVFSLGKISADILRNKFWKDAKVLNLTPNDYTLYD